MQYTDSNSVPSGRIVRWPLLLLFAVQLLWWTVIPYLSHTSPPLDANEMHAWSLAPQWGYYKHPPMPIWWVAVSVMLFGKNLWALFIPSALAISLTYAAIWPVARILLPPKQAVIALFLQSTVLFYHLWSTDFNHNIVQMPFWAWSLTTFYFAACYPPTRGQMRWWLMFGVMLGLNSLAKYTAALIVPCALLYLLWTPAARGSWIQFVRNLLFAFFGFAITFGPHVVWLFANDFGPLHYATGRMSELGETASWSERFLSYLGLLIVAHIVPIGVAIWLALKQRSVKGGGSTDRFKSSLANPDLRGFWLLGFGPVAVTILIGLCGVSLAPMWSSAMLPWVGLAVVLVWRNTSPLLWSRTALIAWLILELLLGTIYWVKGSNMWYQFSQRSARGAYPGPLFSAEVEKAWAQRFPKQKLLYVAGPTWEAGLLSFFAKGQTPMVLIDGDPAHAPWVDLKQLEACGAVFINPDEATAKRFPALQKQAELTVAPIAKNFPVVHVNWSVLAPQDLVSCHGQIAFEEKK